MSVRYARIAPKKRIKTNPPHTRRYRHRGKRYDIDDDPGKPKWYRISHALADELSKVVAFEGAPPTFEILTESEWKRRLESFNAIKFSVVDLTAGAARRVDSDELAEDDDEGDEEEGAEAEDVGRVDVGASKPKRKAKAKPKRKTAKKKTAKRASKKAPRASS